MTDELIPNNILNWKLNGKTSIGKPRECRMDGVKRSMMGREFKGYGTVEAEDRNEAKENLCAVEESLLNNSVVANITSIVSKLQLLQSAVPVRVVSSSNIDAGNNGTHGGKSGFSFLSLFYF